jgi:hypothetical protein
VSVPDSVTLNGTALGLLKGQIMRDIVWCSTCARKARARAAEVRYMTKSREEVGCKECFADALRTLAVSASSPVTQPAYIAVLVGLVPWLGEPPAFRTPSEPPAFHVGVATPEESS